MTAGRFWARVNKNGPVPMRYPELGPCWLWPRINEQGYGKTTVKLKHWSAHRLAWVYTHGEIANDLCVCHRCDVRNCVNPGHLFLGTTQDNTADKVYKGRQARGAAIVAGQKTKLLPDDVHDIRRLRAHGFQVKEIAHLFNVSVSHTGNVLRGDFWGHV